MVAGHIVFRHPCLTVRIESGQKDGRFYLGGRYPGMVMDGLKGPACNMQGRAAILTEALNLGAHQGKRLYDSFHGAFLYGFVAGHCHVKILCRQDSGYQAGGGAAVAAVQNGIRPF